MKKFLGFSLVLLLVLGAGLYIAMNYFLGSIVKSGVNKFGPGITQTKVELHDAKISPFSGVGTLSGIEVGNPPGWSPADAFRLGKVHIDMEPASVFRDHIVINELVIDQPEFLYETRLVASNIGDLLKNIEQAVGASRGEVKTKDGKPVKMEVKKLVMKNGKVTIGAAGAALAVPLPPIDMANIGTAEGGITPAQLAMAIMRHVTSNVVAAAAGAIAQGGGASGANTIEAARQVGEALKGIFGGRKQPAETAPAPAPAPAPQPK